MVAAKTEEREGNRNFWSRHVGQGNRVKTDMIDRSREIP